MSFSHMNVPEEVYDLALLFNMRTQEEPAPTSTYYVDVFLSLSFFPSRYLWLTFVAKACN